MIARAPLVRLAVLATTLTAGCTLYGDREFAIETAGRGEYDAELRVTVRAEGGVDRVELLLDGASLGRFDTNREIALDLSRVWPGQHVLEAAVVSGAYRPGRERTTFLVVHPLPEILAVRPPPGGVSPDAPFQIEVEFSRAVFLDPRFDGHVTFGDVRVEPEWSADRRTLRVLAPAVRVGRPAWLSAPLTDLFGRPVPLNVSPYFALGITYALEGELWTNGTVSLSPVATSWSGDPEQLTSPVLYAGDLPIAELGPPPWAPVVWETTDVPEGVYELRVVAPGIHVSAPDWPLRVHVDRTPPVMTCSSAAPGPAPELDVWYGMRVSASEAVRNEEPALFANGQALAFEARGSLLYPPHAVSLALLEPPSPPYVLTAALGAPVDLSGNPAVVSGCTFDVPVWLSPWGSGPIDAPAAVVASELALDAPRSGRFVPEGAPAYVTLAWIAPPSAQNAGELCVVRRAVEPGPPLASLSARAEAVSLSGGRIAWMEAGASPRLSWWNAPAETWVPDPGPFDPSRSVAEPHVGRDHLVWTETDGAGHRTLGGARAEPGGGWWSIQGDVRLNPLADVAHPATFGGSVAFLETIAGVPQVRAAQGYAWWWYTVEEPLNVDPAVPASDPTSAAGDAWAVAWVENHQVVARIVARPLPGPAGAAELLNVDPARAARWPKGTTSAGHPAVVFVEAGPSGDEIWIRRYEDGAWTLLPGPVNAAAPGPVTALAVSFGPSIAWADADGHVRLRVYNQ